MNAYYGTVILSLIALIALIMQTFTDNQMDRETKKRFCLAFVMLIIANIAECLGVILNGTDLGDDMLLKLAKTIDYIFTPLALAFFLFVFNDRKIKNVAIAMSGINGILAILSIPFGWYFTVDPMTHYYEHNELYAIYAVIVSTLSLLLLFSLFKFGMKHGKKSFVAVIFICIVFAFGLIVQCVDSSWRVTLLSLTLAALLTFIYYAEHIKEDLALTAINERTHQQKYRSSLDAMAKNYYFMAYVSLNPHSYEMLIPTEAAKKILSSYDDISDGIRNLAIFFSTEEDAFGLASFVNLDTLDSRLKSMNALNYEFNSKQYGRCRATFIAVDKASDRYAKTAVFTIEIIEEAYQERLRLQSAATIDGLTGLLNQGQFFEAERQLTGRLNEVGFIVADLDELKTINDQQGHSEGDKAIQKAAEAITEAIGDNGTCYRIGGDEFAVILKGTKTFKIVHYADKVRTIAQAKGVSISVGTYQTSDTTMSVGDIFRYADTAMYAEKRKKGVERL